MITEITAEQENKLYTFIELFNPVFGDSTSILIKKLVLKMYKTEDKMKQETNATKREKLRVQLIKQKLQILYIFEHLKFLP